MSSFSPFSASSSSPASADGRASGGLNSFEAEIVGVFSDLVVLLGLPKSMGEIYGFIFASAEPPTFSDIEHKLGLSKGSVSQGLRALRELGAIRDADATEGGRRTDEARQRGDGQPAAGWPRSTSGAGDRAGRPLGGAGNNDGGPDGRTKRASPAGIGISDGEHGAGSVEPQSSDLPAPAPQASRPSGSPSSGLPSSGSPVLRASSLPASAARATRWEATTELRQLIGTLLRERLTPYLERQDQRMQSAELALEAEAPRLSGPGYKALKRRLEKLQTWQSRARTVLPVLGKML